MKYQEFAISDKLNNSACWRDKNENEVKWFNWNSTAFKNENHAKMSANGLWFKLNKPEDIEVICQQDLSYEKKLGQIRYEQLVSLTPTGQNVTVHKITFFAKIQFYDMKT